MVGIVTASSKSYFVTVTEVKKILSVTSLLYRGLNNCTGYFITLMNGKIIVLLLLHFCNSAKFVRY